MTSVVRTAPPCLCPFPRDKRLHDHELDRVCNPISSTFRTRWWARALADFGPFRSSLPLKQALWPLNEPLAQPPLVLAEQDAPKLGESVSSSIIERPEDPFPVLNRQRDDGGSQRKRRLDDAERSERDVQTVEEHHVDKEGNEPDCDKAAGAAAVGGLLGGSDRDDVHPTGLVGEEECAGLLGIPPISEHAEHARTVVGPLDHQERVHRRLTLSHLSLQIQGACG